MNAPDILFEDTNLLVINKPAGWIAHPGAGEQADYVVSIWLSEHAPEIAAFAWPYPERAGIVHRLDKDTTGVMVLAKTPESLVQLQAQFKAREIEKVYHAYIFGVPRDTEGTIETYIGRHPKHRQSQTVLPIPLGEIPRRLAVTEYHVTQTYHDKDQPIAKIVFYPKTGRMHQLRVHAKYLGTPILGDPVYTTKSARRYSVAHHLTRQMLHAVIISLTHPSTDVPVTFQAPYPSDMLSLTEQLEAN